MNLGSDDNRIFPFFRGVGVVFWQEKEETDEMTEKMSCLKPNIRKSTGLDEMLVPQKTLKSACVHRTHTQTHTHSRLSGFELRWMLSVTFQTWERRRGTVHLLDCRYSLFTEKHIQPSILQYQPATILETACILCISLFEPHMAIKRDNMAKWCPRVAELKMAVYSLITPLHHFCTTNKAGVHLALI